MYVCVCVCVCIQHTVNNTNVQLIKLRQAIDLSRYSLERQRDIGKTQLQVISANGLYIEPNSQMSHDALS